MSEEDDLLDLARRLAAAGSEQLLAHAAERNEVVATKSTEVDPVTAADLAASACLEPASTMTRTTAPFRGGWWRSC